MPFRLKGSDLLISVVHPGIDPLDAGPVPIPPPGAHPPNWYDDMRAILVHASATLEAGTGIVAPPKTLVEATALEQHLVRALRLVREVKEDLAKTAKQDDDQTKPGGTEQTDSSS